MKLHRIEWSSHSDDLLAVFRALPDIIGWPGLIGFSSFALWLDSDLCLRTLDRCVKDFPIGFFSWAVFRPVLFSKPVFGWAQFVSFSDLVRFGDSLRHSSCSGAKSCSLFRLDSFEASLLSLLVRDLGIFNTFVIYLLVVHWTIFLLGFSLSRLKRCIVPRIPVPNLTSLQKALQETLNNTIPQ